MPIGQPTPTHGGGISPTTPITGTIRQINGIIQIFNGTAWLNITVVNPRGNDMSGKLFVAYKSKNVNSKRFLRQILNVMEEALKEFVMYKQSPLFGAIADQIDCSVVVEFMEEYFIDLVDKKLITVYDIISDSRVNKQPLTDKQINIVIRYQQFNCINTTQIDFNIAEKP